MTLREAATVDLAPDETRADHTPPAPRPAKVEAKKRKAKTVAPKTAETAPTAYVPTKAEANAAARTLERLNSAENKPRFDYAVASKGTNSKIGPAHPDPIVADLCLMDTFATANYYVSGALLSQLANIAAPHDEVDAAALSRNVALVQGIGPRDEAEAMLATQMTAVHNATMAAAHQFQRHGLPSLHHQVAFGKLLCKLSSTFAEQFLALKRSRGCSVQHIVVHRADGKPPNETDPAELTDAELVATIGTGARARGATENDDYQPHAPRPGRADEPRSALHRHLEAIAQGLPRPSGKRS
jgi:hypothetical protein